MKNTRKSGILHFRIFKWSGRYLGICKETGFVEEAGNFVDVKNKLLNGTVAVLKAVLTSEENLEASLNTSPPLKYLIYYYIAPLLVMIESIKDATHAFKKNTDEVSGNYSFFAQSIATLKHNG